METLILDLKIDPDSKDSIGKKDRRTILKRLLGIGVISWLGMILYPVWRFLTPPPMREANVASLKVANIADTLDKSFKIFQFGRKPGILIKDQRGDFRSLSATCTHLSCIVQYEADDNIIWCACHNARFDLTGKVVSGPPPHPLEEFDVNVKANGEIWVSKKEA